MLCQIKKSFRDGRIFSFPAFCSCTLQCLRFFSVGPIHLDGLGVVLEAPDAAGADARADAAADALRRVGDVFPAAVLRLDARDRLLRAGIDAHAAVAAGAAGDAARVFLSRVRKVAVVALLEVGL